MIQIPESSFLRCWHDQFDNTEVWPSWRIATGLTMVGAVLGRGAGFPFGKAGMLWPNIPTILVGVSGGGKDTINRPAEDLLKSIGVNAIAGRTMEAVKLSLARAGDPAVGFIAANELKDFLGGKDYQAGMVEALTDLLSNNNEVDITTKADLLAGHKVTIHHPTLSLFSGSTVDWLQKLPGDALGGGFFGRFLVMPEIGINPRLVPNPGRYESFKQKQLVESSIIAFLEQMKALREEFRPGRPLIKIVEDKPAEEFYDNWYENAKRGRYFPPSLTAYANRATGMLRKIGMVTAVTCGRRHIEPSDYQFAADILKYIAERLERTILPIPREVTVGYDVLELLPRSHGELLRVLAPKHGPMWVKRGVAYLVESGQVSMEKNMVKKAETFKEKNDSTSPSA